MAHEIETVAGRARMFAREGRRVWHGLGWRFLQGERVTSEQVLDVIGRWTVHTTPTHWRSPSGEELRAGSDVAIYRDDPENVVERYQHLGHAQAGYVPIQNADLALLVDGIAETGAQWEAAGSIFGGRRVWMLAKNPNAHQVGPDTIEDYVLVVAGHDGTCGVHVARTMVAVICANTYSIAMRRTTADTRRTIHHRGDALASVRSALDSLGALDASARNHLAMFGRLASEPFTFGDFSDLADRLSVRMSNPALTAELLENRWRAGLGQSVRGETRWRALNAVTDCVDHIGTVGFSRGDEATSARKFLSAVNGEGQQLKTAALDALCAF